MKLNSFNIPTNARSQDSFSSIKKFKYPCDYPQLHNYWLLLMKQDEIKSRGSLLLQQNINYDCFITPYLIFNDYPPKIEEYIIENSKNYPKNQDYLKKERKKIIELDRKRFFNYKFFHDSFYYNFKSNECNFKNFEKFWKLASFFTYEINIDIFEYLPFKAFVFLYNKEKNIVEISFKEEFLTGKGLDKEVKVDACLGTEVINLVKTHKIEEVEIEKQEGAKRNSLGNEGIDKNVIRNKESKNFQIQRNIKSTLETYKHSNTLRYMKPDLSNNINRDNRLELMQSPLGPEVSTKNEPNSTHLNNKSKLFLLSKKSEVINNPSGPIVLIKKEPKNAQFNDKKNNLLQSEKSEEPIAVQPQKNSLVKTRKPKVQLPQYCSDLIFTPSLLINARKGPPSGFNYIRLGKIIWYCFVQRSLKITSK